jgi:hypothetical protein
MVAFRFQSEIISQKLGDNTFSGRKIGSSHPLGGKLANFWHASLDRCRSPTESGNVNGTLANPIGGFCCRTPSTVFLEKGKKVNWSMNWIRSIFPIRNLRAITVKAALNLDPHCPGNSGLGRSPRLPAGDHYRAETRFYSSIKTPLLVGAEDC